MQPGRRGAPARAAALLAAALLAGCARSGDTLELRSPPVGPRALNEAIELALDGPLDPLGVDARSVRVLLEDGRELDARRSVRGGNLWLELVVTPALFAEHPQEVTVQMAGLPSPRALASVDGRRLRTTTRCRIPLTGRLQSPGPAAPRLMLLDGAPPTAGPIKVAGPLVLVFDGVLDPHSVTSAACPLFPIAGEVELSTPVLAGTDWTCVGGRFELRLDVPRGAGRLRLVLRKFTVRDLSGRSPEPALRAELDAS